MTGLSRFRQINLSTKLLGLLVFVLFADLTRLLFTKKIAYLFVDDWAIFKDFSANDHGVNTINLAPYNGHSLLVTRILFIFVTRTIGIQIPTFSITLTFFLIGTVFLLARRISSASSEGTKNLAVLTVVLVCLNLNQYQNLTMPICWSWGICLIFIIWTYLLVNQNLNIYRGTVLLILSLIGPLTLSFGFIIPGFLILKLFYDLYRGNRNVGVILLLSCIIFCTFFAYISAIINSESEYGGFSNPIRIITRPINSIIFLLTSIGSPFTPASRFSVQIASVFGLFVSLLLVKILREAKNLSVFFLEDALITIGIIFHMIHLLGRYDGSWLSILTAAQPRYSTGAILLVLGLLLNLIRRGTKNINLVLVIVLGTMTLSGMKTAEDFSSVRHSASVKIATCVSNYSLSSLQCDGLLDPGNEILSKADFRKAIIYLEKVN